MKKAFEIDSDYKQVSILTTKIDAILFKYKILKKIRDEITTVLYEALNNIIKHAYKNKPNKKIKLSLSIAENELEIKIVDSGQPREIISTPKFSFDINNIENLPESGMGLFIIERLMDSTEYKSIMGENIFILKKFIF